jgi:hypothetical protein
VPPVAIGDVALTGLGEGHWPLALDEIDYRVRYCGWGMDAGHQAGPQMDGEPLVDRYLLQFWPAPPEPDQVIKQTSAQAAYWHHKARKTPPPPTPEQRAEMQRERDRRRAEERLAEEISAWGGRPPSDRLQEIWKAYHLARDHRPLLDALENAAPDTQRAVARRIVRRTCVEAELDQVEWIATALDRIDRGDDPWGALQIPAEAFGLAAPDGPRLIATSGWKQQPRPAVKGDNHLLRPIRRRPAASHDRRALGRGPRLRHRPDARVRRTAVGGLSGAPEPTRLRASSTRQACSTTGRVGGPQPTEGVE